MYGMYYQYVTYVYVGTLLRVDIDPVNIFQIKTTDAAKFHYQFYEGMLHSKVTRQKFSAELSCLIDSYKELCYKPDPNSSTGWQLVNGSIPTRYVRSCGDTGASVVPYEMFSAQYPPAQLYVHSTCVSTVHCEELYTYIVQNTVTTTTTIQPPEPDNAPSHSSV